MWSIHSIGVFVVKIEYQEGSNTFSIPTQANPVNIPFPLKLVDYISPYLYSLDFFDLLSLIRLIVRFAMDSRGVSFTAPSDRDSARIYQDLVDCLSSTNSFLRSKIQRPTMQLYEKVCSCASLVFVDFSLEPL
jgi:hypothetical protein